MQVTSEALAATELFREASQEILGQVLTQAHPKELEAGDILLSPEQDNHYVYLLLSGTFGLHFRSPDSPEIRELPAGTSVGEMSVIDVSRPSAYVIAKEPARVLPIHRDLVQNLVTDANPVARNLLRLMTGWIRSNTQRIVHDQLRIGELSGQANVDGLTGLYNRRWLDNALPRVLEQAQVEQQSLGLLLVDVDHFKLYNDSQGHQGGDQVLVAVGEVLKTMLRPYDFSARYGGEEFVVLLPNTNRDEALSVADRVRRAMEAKPVGYPDGTALPGVTLSIGLAMSDGETTPAALVAAADVKLYHAKSEGRNRVCC